MAFDSIFNGNPTSKNSTGGQATFGIDISTGNLYYRTPKDSGWVSCGGSGSSGNATSIQGVAISAVPPSAYQMLQFNGSQYVPVAGLSTNLLMSQFGPAANGVTDDSAVFTTAMAGLSEIWLDAGKSYFIGTNLTITSALRFLAGAKIIVGNGVTLTVNGQILAPNNQTIFTQSQFTQTFAYPMTTNETPLSDSGAFTILGGANNIGKVASNMYTVTTQSQLSAALYTAGGTSSNQYSEVTINNCTSNGNTNVYALVLGSTSGSAGSYTGYFAWVSGLGNGVSIYLYRYSAGTGVLLWESTTASNQGTGINVAAGDKLRLAVQTSGSNALVSVYYNGTLQTTYTDTTPLAAGYPGMAVYTTQGTLTDAQISNFATGTVNMGNIVMGGANCDVYPEWFGAVGDGSTNDSPAIQLAIDSLSSQGLGGYYSSTGKANIGSVILSSKVYALNTALVVSASGVSIAGQGPTNSTLLWTGNSTSDVLQVSGTTSSLCSFNTLQNFGIGRNGAAGTNAAGVRYTNTVVVYTFNVYSFDNYYCFYQTNGSNAGQGHFRDCQAGANAHTCNTGFYFTNTNGTFDSTRVVDCIVSGAATNGFYVTSTGDGIADIYFDGCESANCNYGHYLSSSYHSLGTFFNDNVHLVRCIHDGIGISGISVNNVYGASAYIDIDSCYVSGGLNNTALIDIENSAGVNIRGCDIRPGGATTDGILVNGSNCNGIIIEGNQFMPSGATTPYAIKIASCSNVVITNNVINGPSASYLWTVGIWCVSATYVLIQGNSLSGYFTTGVTLDSGSSHCGGVNSLNLTAGTAISDSGTNDTVTSI